MLLWCLLANAGPIEEAIAAREAGNLAGASALLDAYTPEPEETGLWHFQRAIQAELLGDHAQAERAYRASMELGGPVGLEAQFRLTLLLRDDGRPEDASRLLRDLARSPFLEPAGRAAVALEQGMAEVDQQVTRRGVRRIQRALDVLETEGGQHYMRARAHVTLASVLCDSADDATMRGPVVFQVRDLRRRVQDLAAAEEQVAAAARLNEPEWVLAGLLRLGDSYSRFAYDLGRVPAPLHLSPPQQVVYRQQLQARTEVLRAKAGHMWRSGVELATRLDWESPRVDQLRLRLGVQG